MKVDMKDFLYNLAVSGGSSGGGYPEPTGTKNINQNGNNIDVKDYAIANVNVPNSYTAQDEGKVVSNGALVSQTSRNIAQNGTFDTTLNDEVVVDVPSQTPTLITKSITQNGTYNAQSDNADGYSEVTVNVPTGGGDSELSEVMNRTITSINDAEARKVPSHFFEQCTMLTSANLPNCTSIGEYAFSMCSSLTDISIPSATSIGQAAFQRSAVVTVDLPAAEETFSQGFLFCASLQSVKAGMLRSLHGQFFRGCTALKSVDILGGMTITESRIFTDCTMLDTLILRNTSSVTQFGTPTVTGFNVTKIASGNGYIYVPAELIDEYKAATNWSTYASQFRALEDYTIDGTTTGALDPNKI